MTRSPDPLRDLPAAAARPPGGSLAHLRVLLAEDEAVNRMVALRMLERLGIVADVAVDGVEVLEQVGRRSYDVVLMDIDMPRLDGLETTAALLERRPLGGPPRIVALTANALEGDRERMLAAGMDGYLSKPVTLEVLADTLRAVGEPRQEPVRS